MRRPGSIQRIAYTIEILLKYLHRVDTGEIASDIIGIIDLIIAFRIDGADVHGVLLECRLHALLVFLREDSLRGLGVGLSLFSGTGTILSARGNSGGAFSYGRDV